MAQNRFSWFDLTITIVSLLTLLVDVGTGIAAAVQLYLGGGLLWGSLVLTFVILPLVVMSGCSLKWHSTDGSLNCSVVLPHVFLLAPVQRYLYVLWFGLRACLSGHPHFTDIALREQNDASILRLSHTFLGSAPQLVLQFCIMLLLPGHTHISQMLSAASSLASLTWSLTVYCDTSRLNYQRAYPRRIAAFCVFCLWQLFMVTARVTALVLFASVLQAWVFLFVGIHWLAMTVWLSVKGVDFGKGRLEQIFFRIVSGYIYVFVYLNVREGPSRGRMTPYYCTIFLENGVLFAIWFIYGKPIQEMKIVSAVLIFGGFLLGGLFLTVYYRWLHPSGPHYLFTVKNTLSTLTQQGYHLPKETVHQQSENPAPDSPSVLRGSVLELSVETESPVKASAKTGDTSAQSHHLDTVKRSALESAWQSGMHSSDSSSSSSLDADECSLDDFNITVKSATSGLKGQCQQNTSPESSTTDQSNKVNTVHHSQASHSVSVTSNTDDTNQAENSTNCSEQSKTVIEIEHMSEPAEQNEDCVHIEDDKDMALLHKKNRVSRSRLSKSSLTSNDLDQTCTPLLKLQSSTPSVKALTKYGSGSSKAKPLSRQPDRTQSHDHSQTISASGVRQSRLGSRSAISSSSASDIVPTEKSACHSGKLSQSFDNGESPILSPEQARQTSLNHRLPPHEDSFTKRTREAMAAFPDGAESISSDLQQQKMYLDSADGYMERAGGESMWGISPNISNNSSSQSRDQELSLPPDTSRLPRLVDSFDSESEPTCLNVIDLQKLQRSKNTSQVHCKRNNSYCDQLKQTSENASPALSSPAENNDETEMSWSSMNVNENEWSGLNNLKALTPDDSLCSFASSEKGHVHKQSPEDTRQTMSSGPKAHAEEAAFSRASTPSVTRSHSTSSLYHEFSSAGVSPSPPPGLRAARLSRNHSWMSSPSPADPWHQPARHLDHLNLDPAPPVLPDAYPSRYDPREVLIEMLMDQLKRSNFRSSSSEFAYPSTFNRSYQPSSASVFDPNRDMADRQPWRHFFADPSATLFNQDSRRGYRNDIDLMRKALDLIEMQRFPQRFGPEVPDSESPEMYVSGEYRPPIVAQDRDTSHVPPIHRTQERRDSHSMLNTSKRQVPAKSSSLPRHSPGFETYSDAHNPQQAGNFRQRSMSVNQREGLYRYFVDSDSPIHTPLWNTPLNTPAVTPSRHLLHPFMSKNPAEARRDDSHMNSAESHTLHVPSSTPRDREHFTSALPYDQGRKPAAHRLSETLEVMTDNHDSGLHSGSHSAASRRQPLQSLDNSPSLSPSSVTQQSVPEKPTYQKKACTKSSMAQRHSHGGIRNSSDAHTSGKPSHGVSHMENPKLGSVLTKPGQALRQAAERNLDQHSVSVASSPHDRPRVKSADCLR